MFDAREVKGQIVKWIRAWFEENGPECNVVIGISGGKDSSVVAALCVEALGKDRVIGVMMPNGIQPDIEDSLRVLHHLGIKGVCVNIGCAVEDLQASIQRGFWGVCPGLSNQARINLPARIRMTALYAVSQSCNGRVANTCNLSEDWIGYSTRYGDAAGDFSPLAKLTSDEVIAVGVACGLPDELVYKVPSDGLCGKPDEDNFGFTYATLNQYIRTGVCEDPATKEEIDRMHKKNLFKLLPMPYFPYSESL